jgi:phosphatidylinositol kinase/protein kinase (PI-3  family)
MAAYSLLSYVFLVKDRHNGNIMLDTDGHVIHIDFGFVLGIAPGNSFSLETAPFKLTAEMVDVMGSAGFERYKLLVRQGLVALHLEAKQILSLVYLSSKDSCFPCFQGKSRARIIRRLERRLCLGWALQDVERTATHMVAKSYNHIGTRHYDKFQQLSNGILP